MGALARFLLILDKLVKGGTIKKIDINLDIAESETIIIKRDELGKYHYVARLKARDWFQFDF